MIKLGFIDEQKFGLNFERGRFKLLIEIFLHEFRRQDTELRSECAKIFIYYFFMFLLF